MRVLGMHACLRRSESVNAETAVRLTLKASVVLNFVAAYLLAFPSSLLGNLLGLPQDVPLLYSSLLSFVVLVFGLIYAWLSRQPSVYQPLLFVGAFGKVCFFLIGVGLLVLESASKGFVGLLAGDFILGSTWFWALHLHRTRHNA